MGGGGGGGGRVVKLTRYLDSPHRLSQYFLIHSPSIKATLKEIKKTKTRNQLFYGPSFTWGGGGGGGGGGYLDSPHMLSQYLLIHSEAIRDIRHKSDQLFRFSTYAFPIPLNTF